MQLRRLFVEDDAVSPVIGTILMVAIAVTMMTAIGAFVLGVGPGEQPPRAELSFAQDPGPAVTINVESTDGLFEEEVDVRVHPDSGSRGPACSGPNPGDKVWDGSGSIDVGKGPTVTQYGSGCGNALSSGDEVLVVWSDNGQSEPLGRHDVF